MYRPSFDDSITVFIRLEDKMTPTEKLLQKVPFTLTDSEWGSIPDNMKGRIRGDYNPGRLPGIMVGNRTLKVGKKMLIEGIDFTIEYSLI